MTPKTDIMTPEQDTTRLAIICLAKMWPGHVGVNYATTTTANLLTLISDAVAYDRQLVDQLRATNARRLADITHQRERIEYLQIREQQTQEQINRLAAMQMRETGSITIAEEALRAIREELGVEANASICAAIRVYKRLTNQIEHPGVRFITEVTKEANKQIRAMHAQTIVALGNKGIGVRCACAICSQSPAEESTKPTVTDELTRQVHEITKDRDQARAEREAHIEAASAQTIRLREILGIKEGESLHEGARNQRAKINELTDRLAEQAVTNVEREKEITALRAQIEQLQTREATTAEIKDGIIESMGIKLGGCKQAHQDAMELNEELRTLIQHQQEGTAFKANLTAEIADLKRQLAEADARLYLTEKGKAVIDQAIKVLRETDIGHIDRLSRNAAIASELSRILWTVISAEMPTSAKVGPMTEGSIASCSPTDPCDACRITHQPQP